MSSLKSTSPPDFYFSPGACSMCPHILLNISGISYNALACNVSAKGPSFPAGYADLNPNMTVPLLVLNDTPITEMPAICTAITHLSPSHNFLGASPLENIRALEFIAFLSTAVHYGSFKPIFRPQMWAESDAGKEEAARMAKQRLAKAFDRVEGWLREGKWAVGEGFTAVDAYLLVFWVWARGVLGTEEMKRWRLYGELMGRVLAVEGVKRTIKEEGLQERVYGEKSD